MAGTTFTSSEFGEDTAGAKKACAWGPVTITERGRPTHVLMTFALYQELTRPATLDMQPGADVQPYLPLFKPPGT